MRLLPLLLVLACNPASDSAFPDDSGSGPLEREQEHMVVMDDGVGLYTHVVLPPEPAEPPFTTLLLRTPYWDLGYDAVLRDHYVPERGYAFVFQHTRGVGSSEGELRPLAQEILDGCPTVRWIEEQDWSDGKVAALGSSYEGFTSIAAAVGCPELDLAIPDGAPVDGYTGWPGDEGGTGLIALIHWYYALEHGDWPPAEDYNALTNHLPAIELDESYLGREIPFWREYVASANARDELWDAMSIFPHYGDIQTPIVHLQARDEWTDDGLEAWQGLVEGAATAETRDAQWFVMGEHQHGGVIYTPTGDSPAHGRVRAAMDHFLDGSDNAILDMPRVLYSVTNGDEWVEADSWEPASGGLSFFLRNTSSDPLGHELADQNADGEPITWTHDPEHEDPCAGDGEALFFTSKGLDEAVTMVGSPTLDLHLSASTPDADVYAYLYRYSRTDGWEYLRAASQRLRFREGGDSPAPVEPGDVYEVELRFPVFAYALEAGDLVGIYITSSACAAHENPNTGEDLGQETAYRAAEITLYNDDERPSTLVVPVR